MPEENGEQEFQGVKKKKQKEESKLSFEIGAVFTPPSADLEAMDKEIEDATRDAARYRASHGQAGTRTQYGKSDDPNSYVSETVRYD